jgi:mannitol/fructose-specific phosphotransferase system IIA component (Ntr-type)
MKLTDYLPPTLVKVPLASTDKTGAITEIVDLVAAQGLTTARDVLLKAVLERETQRSTGVGRGFAIPHAKTDAVSRLVVAMGRTSVPIPFGAIDGQPVELIALLASPTTATSLHIQTLARLSKLVTNGPSLVRILAAQTSEELYAQIAASEAES